MDGSFYASTLRLSQHRELILEERRAAQLLCDQLYLARKRAWPEEAWKYDQAIQKAEMLARYFQAMADQVDRMCLELEQLSVEISSMFMDAQKWQQMTALPTHL